MNGKIHFLNTGFSDCIILQSDGKIAMIDAAEDTDYPSYKPELKKYPGYEELVLDYLFKNFSDEKGKVNIEFVLGTHSHSDHIGGFDTIFEDENINVKTAYLKKYNPEEICLYERREWDNEEVYFQMLEAAKKSGTELISDFNGKKINLGDFEIEFLNADYKKRKKKFGENINSVVTLVKIGKTKALLVGDLNNLDGDERKIAKTVGRVNLLKVGHHGYPASTTFNFVKKLKPQYSVICNSMKYVDPWVKFKLNFVARSQIFATEDLCGVIAEFDGEKIQIKTHTNEKATGQ